MAQIDEITLMAFADGELPDSEAAKVAAALEEDPALQAELDKHMRLKDVIGATFQDLAKEPIPEGILQSLQDRPTSAASVTEAQNPEASIPTVPSPAIPSPRAPSSEAVNTEAPTSKAANNVIAFSAFKRPVFFVPTLVAAALGLFAFTGLMQQQNPSGSSDGLPLHIASILNTTLSTAPNDTSAGPIQVLSSFRRNDGAVCRSFMFEVGSNSPKDTLRQEALACATKGAAWAIVAMETIIPDTAYLPAGGESAPSISALTAAMERIEEYP